MDGALIFYRSQIMSYLCQKCTILPTSRQIKRVENYPDFEKFALVIQHGLERFILKNIESGSTEETFSVILCRSGPVDIFLTIQKVFGVAAQVNEEVKGTEFDGTKNSNF